MSNEKKLYEALASLVDARKRCLADDNATADRTAWADRHEERIEALVKEYMPSGSGFDSGTKIDLDTSTGDMLAFETAYHHMDEHGHYSGWTNHRVVITASLQFGFKMRVGGRDKNQIKSYTGECFQDALGKVVPEPKAEAKKETQDGP